MLTCSCGGPVELVLTQHDDGTETLGPECLTCGADFSDPNVEEVLGEDETFHPAQRHDG